MEEQQASDRVWSTLIQRQTPQVERYACREYLEGFALLNLPPTHVPSLEALNQAITPRTGWRLQRTSIRYSDAVPWYRHFARRIFLITNYMRTWEELDFTPEPDMFHDMFGHLPFMVLPAYTALQEIFGPAFLRTDAEHREQIKRIAWFTTEFGMMREGDGLKVFGAGLLSSVGEIRHVMEGRTPILPFSIENVITRTKAIYTYNETLFAIDSLAALKDELRSYFDSLPTAAPEADPARDSAIEDWELADLADAPGAPRKAVTAVSPA
jgi:phenylalanine-4-hydroxylase